MDKVQTLENLITPAELGQILGLKRSCIYKMLRTGEIPSVRVRSSERKSFLRVRPTVLKRWLAEREVGK